MGEQPTDEKTVVHSDDPVHLEKSGLGDHGGLDDSNVRVSHSSSKLLIDPPASSPDMTTKRPNAFFAKLTIASCPC